VSHLDFVAAEGGSNQTTIDCHFMALAQAQRSFSHDPMAKVTPRSSVGAVIARDIHFVASSANILPERIEPQVMAAKEEFLKENRAYLIEHAERAAIIKAFLAGEDLNGTTMYCTRFPCSDCSRVILAAGITRLVVGDGFGNEIKWIESQRASNFALRTGGVTVRYLDIEKC
tara:strand:+ start:516 stop:1031 length:516 start_codon:yes stop_codon:yes gene_type:complete